MTSTDNNGRFWLNKEISLRDILAFIAAFVAVVSAYYSYGNRISVLEDARAAQVQVDARQDDALKAARIDLKEDLKDIKAQLQDIRADIRGKR